MIRFLAVLLFPLTASAQAWQTGEALDHRMLALCISKESVVAIVEADVKGGVDAAMAAFAAGSDCRTVIVTGYTVGRVVHTAKVKRDDGEKTVSVVEVVDPDTGKAVAYFPTTSPVTARLSVEPKRGSQS